MIEVFKVYKAEKAKKNLYSSKNAVLLVFGSWET